MKLYNSWKDVPDVPEDWKPAKSPGSVVKVPVKNRRLLQALRKALSGKWLKIYRYGRDGTELHYFQHESGKVCRVKHKIKR